MSTGLRGGTAAAGQNRDIKCPLPVICPSAPAGVPVTAGQSLIRAGQSEPASAKLLEWDSVRCARPVVAPAVRAHGRWPRTRMWVDREGSAHECIRRELCHIADRARERRLFSSRKTSHWSDQLLWG
jgi:hypothetical protein